jgi:hypothetical protein
MADDENGGARGSIGVEIFEQVERMLAEDKITRAEAFKRLSDETGRKPGTVAANYYRIARKRGAPLQPRGRRGSRAGRGRGRAGSGDAAAALGRAMSALEELSGVVRRQEQEISRLRAENEGFNEIRRLMKRVK